MAAPAADEVIRPRRAPVLIDKSIPFSPPCCRLAAGFRPRARSLPAVGWSLSSRQIRPEGRQPQVRRVDRAGERKSRRMTRVITESDEAAERPSLVGGGVSSGRKGLFGGVFGHAEVLAVPSRASITGRGGVNCTMSEWTPTGECPGMVATHRDHFSGTRDNGRNRIGIPSNNGVASSTNCDGAAPPGRRPAATARLFPASRPTTARLLRGVGSDRWRPRRTPGRTPSRGRARPGQDAATITIRDGIRGVPVVGRPVGEGAWDLRGGRGRLRPTASRPSRRRRPRCPPRAGLRGR